MTTSKSNTHAYVRPSSLRTEHNDDMPKPWMGIGANGNKFGTVVGTNNVNYNNYNANFEMESLTGGLPSSVGAAAAAVGVGSSSGSLSGWYYPTKMDGIFALWNIIVSLITQSISSMGENKTRCYILLFLTVVAECYATALSKQAKEIGSAPLFFWSCFVNFFWYVTLCVLSSPLSRGGSIFPCKYLCICVCISSPSYTSSSPLMNTSLAVYSVIQYGGV